MINSSGPYCSIPLYYDALSGIYETLYSDTVLLSRVEETCGCTLHLMARPYTGSGAAVIIASHGLNAEESRAVQAHGADVRVGVFHLSDESRQGNNDNSYYPALAFVYRNYDIADKPLRYMHLAEEGISPNRVAEEEAAGGHVFWYPLGPANNFIPTRAFVQPAKLRRHLWAFIGGIDPGKEERGQMMSALRDHPQTTHLFEVGNFLDSKNFGNNVLLLNDYMRPYYGARFVPCPAGQNPEQFRIWEALEAGAIPIVLRRHLDRWLKFVPLLALEVARIESWADLPDFLLRAEAKGDKELAAWQAALYMRWLKVKRRLVDGVANSICSLKPHALVARHGPPPPAPPPGNATVGHAADTVAEGDGGGGGGGSRAAQVGSRVGSEKETAPHEEPCPNSTWRHAQGSAQKPQKGADVRGFG